QGRNQGPGVADDHVSGPPSSTRRISCERSARSGPPCPAPTNDRRRTGWSSAERSVAASGSSRTSSSATARSARTWSGVSRSTRRCSSLYSYAAVTQRIYRAGQAVGEGHRDAVAALPTPWALTPPTARLATALVEDDAEAGVAGEHALVGIGCFGQRHYLVAAGWLRERCGCRVFADLDRSPAPRRRHGGDRQDHDLELHVRHRTPPLVSP